MALIRIKDRDGQSHELEAPNGEPLMEILRDEDMGVDAICGGTCSCGTCHVYVAQDWQDKIPAKSEDEDMMLEAIGEHVEVRDSSRLSCQIEITPEMEGLSLEIGPVVE